MVLLTVPDLCGSILSLKAFDSSLIMSPSLYDFEFLTQVQPSFKAFGTTSSITSESFKTSDIPFIFIVLLKKRERHLTFGHKKITAERVLDILRF